MARLAVFASGSGSNFEAIAVRMETSDHTLACLVCDKQGAYVLERAKNHRIPSRTVSYKRRNREQVEREIIAYLKEMKVDLIALAGYMRLFTPLLVEAYENRIVNIHPSLLPKYPGIHGIRETFDSGDPEAGITIHHVDNGMDTGPVILQKRINRLPEETLLELETRIHTLEHKHYPEVILELLRGIDLNQEQK